MLLYCDFKSDESYTPSKIEILYGNDFNDLQSVKTKSFEEPRGWIEIPIRNNFGNPINCWMIQVSRLKILGFQLLASFLINFLGL